MFCQPSSALSETPAQTWQPGGLIFELNGLPKRDLEKLKQEAERLGKAPFAFAIYMDRHKQERTRGATIAFIRRRSLRGSGITQLLMHLADLVLITVPVDASFITAIGRGYHNAGKIQGQTRERTR